MEWQPIEAAPKDRIIVCWRPGWRPCFLIWKTNPRIVDAHKKGFNVDHSEEYFGDPDEMDDYDLALPGKGATHWILLPDTPPAPCTPC